MAITNPTPQPKEVVILQRDDGNAFYEEVHASGSLVIPYLDANGHLNFDDSASFYTVFPPTGGTGGGGTTLYTGSTYQITASWSSQSLVAISASWASSSISASYAGSSSWTNTASWAINAISGGTQLITASVYPITASWAETSVASISSSWASSSVSSSHSITAISAISSSWASESFSANTASWASQSFSSTTASWASTSFSATTSSWTSTSFEATSASWASSSTSASYSYSSSWAINALTASYVSASNIVGVLTSSIAESSSWASQSLSSSWAPGGDSIYSVSASWASQSLSSSFADTASYLTPSNNYTVNQLTINSLQRIDPITGLTVTQIAGGNYDDTNSYYLSFTIYTYKTVNGNTVYSTFVAADFTEVGDIGGAYHLSMSWTPVVGADGYKIVITNDEYNGYYGTYYLTSSIPSILYGQGNELIAVNEDPVVVTPTSIGMKLVTNDDYVEITGSVKIDGVITGIGSGLTDVTAKIVHVPANSYAFNATPAGFPLAGMYFNATSPGIEIKDIDGSTKYTFGLTTNQKATFVNPVTMSAGLNVVGNISCSVITASGINCAGYGKFNSTVGAPVYVGGMPGGEASYAGLWVTSTPLATNYSFLAQPNGRSFFNAASADVEFRIANSTYFAVGVDGVAFGLGSNVNPKCPLQIKTATSNFVVTQSGKVGIGTLTPFNALDVVGNISCSVITASLFGSASYATSASWAPGGSQGSAESSSWASASISASYAPYGRSIVFCSAYTPTSTGADSAEISIPFSPLDGISSLSWNVRRLVVRTQISESVGSVIDIEKSMVAGAFSASLIGTVNLIISQYEAVTTGSLGVVNSGDKLRFNITTLGTAQNWTIITEISNA